MSRMAGAQPLLYRQTDAATPALLRRGHDVISLYCVYSQLASYSAELVPATHSIGRRRRGEAPTAYPSSIANSSPRLRRPKIALSTLVLPGEPYNRPI